MSGRDFYVTYNKGGYQKNVDYNFHHKNKFNFFCPDKSVK